MPSSTTKQENSSAQCTGLPGEQECIQELIWIIPGCILQSEGEKNTELYLGILRSTGELQEDLRQLGLSLLRELGALALSLSSCQLHSCHREDLSDCVQKAVHRCLRPTQSCS